MSSFPDVIDQACVNLALTQQLPDTRHQTPDTTRNCAWSCRSPSSALFFAWSLPCAGPYLGGPVQHLFPVPEPQEAGAVVVVVIVWFYFFNLLTPSWPSIHCCLCPCFVCRFLQVPQANSYSKCYSLIYFTLHNTLKVYILICLGYEHRQQNGESLGMSRSWTGQGSRVRKICKICNNKNIN